MGAWGVKAFDNDSACDWKYDLQKVDNLSLVEAALNEAEKAGEYLDSDVACHALAACEVLARLQGNRGYSDAYTVNVDEWVAKHPIIPEPELIARASRVIDLVLGENSELAELWDEGDDFEWRHGVEELRTRLVGQGSAEDERAK
jgi:hypothetical protein